MRINKSAKFFLEILKLKIFKRFKPITAIVNVTNRCNCRCKHCYASYYEQDSSKELTTEQIKAIISDLSSNGCQRISFSGGEPLLRKDIGELIEFVNAKRMSLTLNSNGILVTENIEILKKLDSLAISLDGRPRNHDILRGNGTGEKALQGILAASKSGIRVHVNMVLNQYNLSDIDYILDLAEAEGFFVEFGLIISPIKNDQKNNSNFKPSNDQFKDALKYIIRKKEEGRPILFSKAAYQSVLNSWNDFSIEGVINQPPPNGMPECVAGKFFCIIDASGYLWACPHLIGKIKADNVLEVGVARAWNQARRHPCCGCYQVYHHEFSLLMNLNFKVLLNYAKQVLFKKKR
ncbi:MAG: radical SAM protein [Candidatus Omnitrophica bacterium]|nr:radical SAM protein [Candidatus Omnitrophota bacterium]